MIIFNIDVMLAKRKMSLTELSEKVGITLANLSILKTGKAKAVRFTTLEAICKALEIGCVFVVHAYAVVFYVYLKVTSLMVHGYLDGSAASFILDAMIQGIFHQGLQQQL